ncbi:unnamed protein product [Brassicogethes aeneus]|uniref:Uncharacterized protein n=1 Tax=Brassicogethes aeneus TaxID=1431903 RepID=A0A9P0FLT3_BRAAE|nr:unnamed protein product [Brassicogethes aeneus]
MLNNEYAIESSYSILFFFKNANELDSLLSVSEERDEQATRGCKVSMELMQSKHDQLIVIDSEILELMLESEASENDIGTQCENSEEYKRKYLDLQCKYESVFKCVADEEISLAKLDIKS